MIKRISLKKISICIIALISIFLFNFFSNNELKINKTLEYKENISSTIFLLDENNYLAKTSINLDDKSIKLKAKKLLLALINDEKYQDIIPNGFKSIIPSNTKILNIYYKDNVIKVDFSSDLLNVDKQFEEKIIEDIVYTLTSIKEIKYVIIYVNGEILTKLPKSNIILPATLDRNFGINKEYNINSDKDIVKTTVYYINKYNDNYYYVPVTKINNSNKQKAEIIIDELKHNNIYNSHLMSFLNNNVQITNLEYTDKILTLELNDKILNNDTNTIPDEVIDTICLSLNDNYDINEILIKVDNKEILDLFNIKEIKRDEVTLKPYLIKHYHNKK